MKNFWFKQLSKFSITIILVLSTLICLKANPNLKKSFYENVYEKNISFASINAVYEKYAGSPLPFNKYFQDNLKPVFNEKLEYTEAHKYLDGVRLAVQDSYLVPVLDSGLVIFIGQKENYGNTVIVQQANGVDVWYCNIDNVTVSMYDYIEKGSLVGEVTGKEIYLVFKKDGEILKYEDYI